MSNIFTGKTVEEAKQTGLAQMNLTEDAVEVLVIEQGSRGFLGIGAKQARVQLIVKKPEQPTEVTAEQGNHSKKANKPERKDLRPEKKKAEKPVTEPVELKEIDNPSEDAKRTVKFLEGLLSQINVEGQIKVVAESEERVVLEIVAKDSSSVIGYRGEVLDSMQTMAGAIYNTDKEKYLRVVVDCENYREKRERTLVNLANKLAQKALASGRKITLEPMNPFERRIIHSALMDVEGVKTASEGKEPNRFVAIIPDGYDPSKNHRSSGRFGGKGKGGKPYNKKGSSGERSSSSNGAAKKSAFSGGVFLGNSKKDGSDNG